MSARKQRFSRGRKGRTVDPLDKKRLKAERAARLRGDQTLFDDRPPLRRVK